MTTTTATQIRFQIIITATATGLLEAIHTAPTASQMEDMVTALHKEFPSTHFQFAVRTVPYWPNS